MNFSGHNDELLFFRIDKELLFRISSVKFEGPLDNKTKIWRDSWRTDVTTAGENPNHVTSPPADILDNQFLIDMFQIGCYYDYQSIFMKLFSSGSVPRYFLQVVESKTSTYDLSENIFYFIDFN